jgi:hypothetical protein
MSARVKKMMPIWIVMGVLGYLCWPYMDGPVAKQDMTNPAKTIEALAALLSPPTAPAPDRDPFNSQTPTASARLATGPDTKKTASTAQGATQAAAPRRATETVVASTLGDLSLQGTHIWGKRRLAVINGSVYAEGEEIKASGAMTGSYKVDRVFAHKVQVQCDGQTVELTYPGHEPNPSADPMPFGATNEKPAQSNPAKTN